MPLVWGINLYLKVNSKNILCGPPCQFKMLKTPMVDGTGLKFFRKNGYRLFK